MAKVTNKQFELRPRNIHTWAVEARALARANPGKWIACEPPPDLLPDPGLFNRDFNTHREGATLYIKTRS